MNYLLKQTPRIADKQRREASIRPILLIVQVFKNFKTSHNLCISTSISGLSSLFRSILLCAECYSTDRDFKITHFMFVFNAKKKGLELTGLHYSSRGLHKKQLCIS